MIIFKLFGSLIMFLIFIALFIAMGAIIFILVIVGKLRRGVNQNSKRRDANSSNTHSYSGTNSTTNTTANSTSSPQQKKKIIPKEEGEYVDFEEVGK